MKKLLCFVLIFVGISNLVKVNFINTLLIIISLLGITVPFLIDIVNYIIFKESNISGAVYAYKKFS